MSAARVLLVEDEELVGTMVRMNLEGAGYEVDWVRDGLAAEAAGADGRYDLILLDINLPGRDGISLLDGFRKAEITVPVMMLTAKSDVPTKVSALELGADDYLAKPFDVAEMLARVAALVRRSQGKREIPSHSIVQVGAFRVNLETRHAESNEGDVTLSEKEADMLAFLVRSPGRTLSRSDILENVWGMDVFPTERTVDNFIVRLRKLFEAEPEVPRHFLTIRGVGYRFVP